jgi:hypothetical protein
MKPCFGVSLCLTRQQGLRGLNAYAWHVGIKMESIRMIGTGVVIPASSPLCGLLPEGDRRLVVGLDRHCATELQ